MTTHEISINPFHVPSTTENSYPDNVVEGDYFPNLALRDPKSNSDKIEKEQDSDEPPKDNNTAGIINTDFQRKSSLSYFSNSQCKLDNDDYEEDPKDQPWVDKFKPRLVPDWTDDFKSDQN